MHASALFPGGLAFLVLVAVCAAIATDEWFAYTHTVSIPTSVVTGSSAASSAATTAVVTSNFGLWRGCSTSLDGSVRTCQTLDKDFYDGLASSVASYSLVSGRSCNRTSDTIVKRFTAARALSSAGGGLLLIGLVVLLVGAARKRSACVWVAPMVLFLLAGVCEAAVAFLWVLTFNVWLACGVTLCELARSSGSCTSTFGYSVYLLGASCVVGLLTSGIVGCAYIRVRQRVPEEEEEQEIVFDDFEVEEAEELKERARAQEQGGVHSTPYGSPNEPFRLSDGEGQTGAAPRAPPGGASTQHTSDKTHQGHHHHVYDGTDEDHDSLADSMELGASNRSTGPRPAPPNRTPQVRNLSMTAPPNRTPQNMPLVSPETGAAGGGDQKQHSTGRGGGEEGPQLPPGDWALDPESGYYWSEAEQLFLDLESGQYYDPHSDQWYDPATGDWYTDGGGN